MHCKKGVAQNLVLHRLEMSSGRLSARIPGEWLPSSNLRTGLCVLYNSKMEEHLVTRPTWMHRQLATIHAIMRLGSRTL